MGLVFFIGYVSLVLFLISFALTNNEPDLVSAFHQNYPEFDNKEDIKNLYTILKDSPYFKSKIIQLESIANDVSIECNTDTLVNKTEKNETANKNLAMCDEDIQAMKGECDKHYNIMAYCKDKSDFMTSYLVSRNLTEDSVGKIASVLP